MFFVYQFLGAFFGFVDPSCTLEAFFEILMTTPLRLGFFQYFTFQFLPFFSTMHNISHFRSVLMLPLMIFLTSKSIIGIRSFFFSQHLFLVFDNYFFIFQCLFPNIFFCNFQLLNLLELLTFFSILRPYLFFQKLGSLKFLLSFQLTKNIFLKIWTFYIFSLLFQIFQAVFILQAFLSPFGGFLRVF